MLLVANSARFQSTLPLLWGEPQGSVFECFLDFSDWLYMATGQTHQLAMERLFELLHAYLTEVRRLPAGGVVSCLAADYARSGAKGKLSFMARAVGDVRARVAIAANPTPPRQTRRLAA